MLLPGCLFVWYLLFDMIHSQPCFKKSNLKEANCQEAIYNWKEACVLLAARAVFAS